VWNRYSEYCGTIGLGDNLFLEDMSQIHRIKIIGDFAVAVHQGKFSCPRDAPLAESTVSDTLTMWLRSTGKMGTATQNRMSSVTSHDFYSVN